MTFQSTEFSDMFTELRKDIHVAGNNHSVPMKVKSNPVVGASPRTSIEPTMAVLVITCNRVDYTRQTLDELLRHRPSAGLFPIIVSQDCGHQPTADVIAGYGARITHIKVWVRGCSDFEVQWWLCSIANEYHGKCHCVHAIPSQHEPIAMHYNYVVRISQPWLMLFNKISSSIPHPLFHGYA